MIYINFGIQCFTLVEERTIVLQDLGCAGQLRPISLSWPECPPANRAAEVNRRGIGTRAVNRIDSCQCTIRACNQTIFHVAIDLHRPL